MPSISDRQLRSAYSAFETQLRSNPGTKVDGNGMLGLLAAVADRWWKGADSMQRDLSRPGITRDEQLSLVKQGMDGTEKADLTAILDEGKVPLTDEVRRFLEQVIGRTPVAPTDGALRIDPSQAGGIIKGTVAAGTTIEAINLTTAPKNRLHTDDTFVLAKAGADGKFQGAMPDMQEGDIVRVRTRDARGNAGNWVTVRATGMGGRDSRNVQIEIERLGLVDNKDGTVTVSNINASRQISEPGARIMFVNERTGEKTTVTLNDEGTFADDVKLKGKTGDSFSVRGSDGVNNTSFSEEAGKVSVGAVSSGGTGGVDLPDPKLHKDECNADGTPRFTAKRFKGPLFAGGAHPSDVVQGQIGDCYFPSAIAALAHINPQAIQDAIKDNGNGTYTVTFKDYGRDKQVTVDGDLYARSWGGPLYGHTGGDNSPEKMEMWFPILEKAYAQWKGSYNTIGDGGRSSQVFEELLGRPVADMSIRGNSDAVWRKITQSLDNKLPVSAGTYGEDEKARYTNTGVYPNHSYSVFATKEEGGTRYVQMRNPWGESEPRPGDGKNDGVFWLKLDDFMKLYETVYTVR